MRSLLSMLFSLALLVLTIGTCAFVWYLSWTTEFSRKPPAAPAATSPLAAPPP